MKRIPPSVRVKEEVERLLCGQGVEGAPAETPMRGYVRSLALHAAGIDRGGSLRHFWAGSITGAGDGGGCGGETVTSPGGCKARRVCWSWRSLSCAPPRSAFAPSWSSDWEPVAWIWRDWCEGCTCGGFRLRMWRISTEKAWGAGHRKSRVQKGKNSRTQSDGSELHRLLEREDTFSDRPAVPPAAPDRRI